MTNPTTPAETARDEERWEEFAREQYDLDDRDLAFFRHAKWGSLTDSRRVFLAGLQSERTRASEMVAKIKNAPGHMRGSNEVTNAPTREVWMRADDVLAILKEYDIEEERR